MKKLLLLLVFLPLYIWGSEGMWLPCCLSKQTQQVMKESDLLFFKGGAADAELGDIRLVLLIGGDGDLHLVALVHPADRHDLLGHRGGE